MVVVRECFVVVSLPFLLLPLAHTRHSFSCCLIGGSGSQLFARAHIFCYVLSLTYFVELMLSELTKLCDTQRLGMVHLHFPLLPCEQVVPAVVGVIAVDMAAAASTVPEVLEVPEGMDHGVKQVATGSCVCVCVCVCVKCDA